MAGVAASNSAGIGFDTQPADDRRLNRLRRRQAHIQFGSMVEEVFMRSALAIRATPLTASTHALMPWMKWTKRSRRSTRFICSDHQGLRAHYCK